MYHSNKTLPFLLLFALNLYLAAAASLIPVAEGAVWEDEWVLDRRRVFVVPPASPLSTSFSFDLSSSSPSSDGNDVNLSNSSDTSPEESLSSSVFFSLTIRRCEFLRGLSIVLPPLLKMTMHSPNSTTGAPASGEDGGSASSAFSLKTL